VESALTVETEEDGYISEDACDRCCDHLSKHHGFKGDVSVTGKRTQHHIATTVQFHVLYRPRYGIVNLEYLAEIERTALDPEILQSLVQTSQEIRGSPRVKGYTSRCNTSPQLLQHSACGLTRILWKGLGTRQWMPLRTIPGTSWRRMSPRGYSPLIASTIECSWNRGRESTGLTLSMNIFRPTNIWTST
jgi:hypothetical protein